MMKPFSTYPEDRELLMSLARTIQTSNDVGVVDQAAGKLSDLVLAILEDESVSIGALQAQHSDMQRVLRDAYAILAFCFNRIHASSRSRDGELATDISKVRGRIETALKAVE